MPAKWFVAITALIVVGILAGQITREEESLPFEPELGSREATPIAPWIDPEGDMDRFFPGATEFKTEKYPLSGQQLELAKKLGRPLEPGENLLTLHRIYKGAEQVGSVIIRRVKGENGAIDLVIAISETGGVIGKRIQRSREPDDQAQTEALEEAVRAALILYEARGGGIKPHH